MHTSSLDASIGATHALVLAVAAGVEGLTGLAMLIAPFVVTQLLLGGDIPTVAVGLVRLGGGRPALSCNRGLARRRQHCPVAPIAACTAHSQPAHRRAAAISRYSRPLARGSALAGGGAATLS